MISDWRRLISKIGAITSPSTSGAGSNWNARGAIEQAAQAMEARLRYRGRIIYVGAGTSGRLAAQDGAELMPTFSWPRDRLLLVIAGGPAALTQSIEGAEDQADEGARLIREHEADG